MIKLHLDFGTEIELAWTAKANNSHLQVFMLLKVFVCYYTVSCLSVHTHILVSGL